MGPSDVTRVEDVVALWNEGAINRIGVYDLVVYCITKNAAPTLSGFDDQLRAEILSWLRDLAALESPEQAVALWAGSPEEEAAADAAFYPRRDAVRAWLRRHDETFTA